MCGSVCWYAHMSAGACGGQSIRFLRSWSLGGCEMTCVDVDIEFGSSVRAVYSLTMVTSPQTLIRKKKFSFISCCRMAAFFIRSAVPYCKRPSPRPAGWWLTSYQGIEGGENLWTLAWSFSPSSQVFVCNSDVIACGILTGVRKD